MRSLKETAALMIIDELLEHLLADEPESFPVEVLVPKGLGDYCRKALAERLGAIMVIPDACDRLVSIREE